MLSGLLARFIFVTGHAHAQAPPELTPAVQAAREAVQAHARRFRETCARVQTIAFAPGVLENYWALEEAFRARADASLRPDAAGPSLKRLAEAALKIAALLALDAAAAPRRPSRSGPTTSRPPSGW